MAKAKDTGKPVVTYKVTPHTQIVVGERAFVIPTNHPDEVNVENGRHAFTTEVVSYNTDTGEFETKNSRYVPESV